MKMDRCRVPFRLQVTVLVVVCALLRIACPASAEDVGASKSDLIRGLLPTVVNISVTKDEPATPAPTADVNAAAAPDTGSSIKSYVGSGFIIDPSGLVVTNYHVVENAFEVSVGLSDGRRLPGTVLSGSRLADIAVIQIHSDQPFPAIHWGDSDRLQVGDQVFAAGNPFGIGLSVTAGIVSGLNRDIKDSPYDDFIQTDAPINHGNSGGPLFDMQGDVVGVDSTIISPTTGSVGLGFAIPSTTAQFVVKQLLTYGWVRPGWIGIKVQAVSGEIASALGLANPGGSIVSWVLPDGPANRAGLAIGDLILAYDGTAPSDDRALLRDIAHTPAGDTITLLVKRDGTERSVSVTVEAWPRNQWEARDALQPAQRPKIVVPPDLGLKLAPLPEEAKAKLPPLPGLTGVLVTGVAPNSDPANRGMANGDIILRVRDKPVSTPDDVRSGIDSARAAKRDFVLMLVLPKVQDVPGPKWVPLQLATTGG